jgi:signal transduction histidine kinase/ligand-binding sensor domain-containing protein
MRFTSYHWRSNGPRVGSSTVHRTALPHWLDSQRWIGGDSLSSGADGGWRVAGRNYTRTLSLQRRLSFGCFLLVLFLASAVFALNPDRHITQYGHTAWRLQDGFFGGPVRSITQTRDGYIWVGTEAGLFRFDGVRFVSWRSQEAEQLPSTSITDLLGARDGSLWIGTNAGLFHRVNQHLITYLKGEGQISSILQDVNGEIWIARVRGGDDTQPLCQVIGIGVRCYGKEDGVPAFSAAGPLAQDASGNSWIGGDTTLLRWRPGSSHAYRPKALKSNAGIDGVEALSVAADGSIWVGMGLTGHGLGLQHLVNGGLKSFVAPKLNGETVEVLALLEDHEKNLWVGTSNQGIYRIHGADVDHYRTTDGLSSDYVYKLYEDREGNLWVATAKGLDCFRDLRVSSFSTREGLSSDEVNSVLASRDGTIWIGNNSKLDVLGSGGVTSKVGKAFQGHQVTSLLQDRAGRLWAGIDNTLSIYQRGKFRQIKGQDGGPVGVVMGMAEDSENDIWVETMGPPGTLIRIQDQRVREAFPAPQMPLARKIVADPQSGIWLGLLNGDLARYRSGKTEIFPFTHHPASRVNELIAASDGSILGATAFGVVGWKNGKRQILTVRNGLPCNSIHALISDDQGDLWLYAQCGLIEIADAELQRWWERPESRLKLRVFDASDGVQPGRGHFNTSTRSPDGRLWFANGSVLQMIDPNHMAGNTLAPPVHIEAIVADRKSYLAQEGLNLPPLTRDLEIDYTALSFVVPQKALFRYMLEGHDTDWQEPGTRRQAFYNNLRPGHYRFRVIACNNDGMWTSTPAVWRFVILPAYYQTLWFKAALWTTAIMLLWLFYLYRLRRISAEIHSRFNERQRERERIARELHDTLLQGFQGLVLRFQAILNRIPEEDPLRASVRNALLRADEVLIEGRDRVREIRSESSPDLRNLLGSFGDSQASESTSFQLFLVGTVVALKPLICDEVNRIAREALTNAFRHASASRVEAELIYDRAEFNLRIRDNGTGIDEQTVGAGRSGHWGLQGMRERANLSGGKLSIWSRPGAGTEVEFLIPGKLAYAESGQSDKVSWWKRAIWRPR